MTNNKDKYEKSKPYSFLLGCPEGYHKRSSYKSVKNKTIPTRCVRSTTVKNETSKEFKRSVSTKKTRRLKSLKKLLPSIKSLSRKACPPGMIERKEYARKYSTAILQKGYTTKKGKRYPRKHSLSYVGSKCIKNTGLPGKRKQSIGPLRKGELSKYGYSMMETEEKRHTALKKAVEEYGALGVYRKLDAVAKLTARTIPNASKIYEKDKNWIEKKYGPLKAF
jgi:hypothetical protein